MIPYSESQSIAVYISEFNRADTKRTIPTFLAGIGVELRTLQNQSNRSVTGTSRGALELPRLPKPPRHQRDRVYF